MIGAVFVPVSRRGKIVAPAMIDAEDAVRVSAYHWTFSGGYAGAQVDGRRIGLHRFVLGLKHGERFVHHVNENRLDNRKANLEHFATAAEANARPHPKRDQAAREGALAWNAEQRARRAAAVA